MLFIDYSSAFNTIIPDILVSKLTALGLSPSICTWIKDFLTNRPQTVKLGPHHPSTITLSTGSPQGCVLSPLLYSLYTNDCTPTHPTDTIIKFADDTIGLIPGDDESAYRDEVQKLTVWCSDNNLSPHKERAISQCVFPDSVHERSVYESSLLHRHEACDAWSIQNCTDLIWKARK